MKRTLVYIILIISFFSCSGIKTNDSKNNNTGLNSNFYKNQFTGLLIIDPNTNDTIYNYNNTKYFTPASNIKIFTLYSAIKIVPKHIPTLKYTLKNDTLYAQGTGNPAMLHPYFKDSSAINFLKKYTNVAFNFSNLEETKYGPGWAWEDYDTYFSPERSAFPMYGNVLTIYHTDSLVATPLYFKKSILSSALSQHRELHKNTFYYNPIEKDTLEVPFITSTTLSKKLLENVLQKNINLVSDLPDGRKSILYGIASDSIYKRMMHESDNFLAEQLLITSSGILKDTLNFKIIRDHMLSTHLRDLKQKPRWVDGSGLSRYNLFTPESMVYVLHKLYKEVSKERLYNLFPIETNPTEDTKQVLYQPYIHAKSGSLGNNYCLSGYLETRSGKTLIFSFMNNHYRKPTAEVKKHMHQLFEEIRDTY